MKFYSKLNLRKMGQLARRKVPAGGLNFPLLIRHRLVCALHEGNTSPAILRSYKTPQISQYHFERLKIWEAARATSAATTFFAPIEIDDFRMRFVDGGLSTNNPIRVVYTEAQHLWPGRNEDFVLLSIGTGNSPSPTLKGGLRTVLKTLAALATETERTSDQFFDEHINMARAHRLFRFNVTRGLENIKLNEYEHQDSIIEETKSYLNRPVPAQMMENCVSKLRASTQCELQSYKYSFLPIRTN